MSVRIPSFIFPSALFGLVLVTSLAAQTRLYIQEPDGNFHVVCKVSGPRAYIMEKGQAVAAQGQRLALKKVEEFLPVFIAVHDKDSRPTNISVDYANTPINNGVHYSAKFESTELLDDVYAVLELEIPNVGKKIFAYEVGRLSPRIPQPFSADLALGQYMGSGQVALHLFVGAYEVFQSEQPAPEREAALDRMIAKRITGVAQAGPKPLYGTAPAYPAVLNKSGLKGEVVVTTRIDARGHVVEPVIERASAPPFGEEALAAVRSWRFIPQVQEGRAVESKVSIPFAFDPPSEAVTK